MRVLADLPPGHFPRMGHGFPRNYMDVTPQEILFDPTRVLGSPCTRGWTMEGLPEGYVRIDVDHTDKLKEGDLIRLRFPFLSMGHLAFGSEEIFKITRVEPGKGFWFVDEGGKVPSGAPMPVHGTLQDLLEELKKHTSIKSFGVYRRASDLAPSDVPAPEPAGSPQPVEPPQVIDVPILDAGSILPRALKTWLGASLLGLGIFAFMRAK